MWIAAFSALCLASTPATEPLRVNLVADGAFTASGAAVWLVSELALKSTLAPPTCRWCDRASDGTDTLNGLDAWGRGVRWAPPNQRTADQLSSALAFGVLPAAMIALDVAFNWGRPDLSQTLQDLLLIAEAVVATELLNQTVKFIAGRQRPWVHALPVAQANALHDSDANLSFFSGHSSFVFSLTVATATVASLRGYRWGWLAWAVGLPIALAVPYLRMAADMHYLTDVLTGAAVGAACGYGVPTLFHGRTEVGSVQVSLAPAPGGVGVSGTF